MSTEIKTWQVIDGKLQPVDGRLMDAGRKESQDLEAWIASNPAIVSTDIILSALWFCENQAASGAFQTEGSNSNLSVRRVESSSLY